MKNENEKTERHYCESCGFDDLKSKLDGYMCCWFMDEEKSIGVVA